MNQKGKGQYDVVKLKELIDLLVEQNVISVSEIVDLGVQVGEEERDRFIIRTVSVGRKSVYIVKCARYKKVDTALKREVLAYHCLEKNIRLQDIAPTLIMHNTAWSFMVIEWINGVNLVVAELAPEKVAEKLGKTIGKLHQNTLQIEDKIGSSFKPYMLTDLNHQKKWEQYPELDMNIIESRKDVLIQGIRYAEHLWRPNALIHGDLKWEHCLLIEDDKNFGSLRVIDWELATFGDSAWDIACIISDMILNMQFKTEGGSKNVSKALQSEEVKIFLQNYAKERVIGDHLLKHTSSYLGVRLFQTALELTTVYGWESRESNVDILLSMAVDIFNDCERFSKILQNRLSE